MHNPAKEMMIFKLMYLKSNELNLSYMIIYWPLGKQQDYSLQLTVSRLQQNFHLNNIIKKYSVSLNERNCVRIRMQIVESKNDMQSLSYHQHKLTLMPCCIQAVEVLCWHGKSSASGRHEREKNYDQCIMYICV